jgi:hypothetical protein
MRSVPAASPPGGGSGPRGPEIGGSTGSPGAVAHRAGPFSGSCGRGLVSPGAVAHVAGPSSSCGRGLVSPGAVAHVRLLSCSAVVDGRWSPGSITHFGSLRVGSFSGMSGVHQARLRIGTSSPECRLGAAWTPLPRSRACSAVGSATAAPPPRRNACVRTTTNRWPVVRAWRGRCARHRGQRQPPRPGTSGLMRYTGRSNVTHPVGVSPRVVETVDSVPARGIRIE